MASPNVCNFYVGIYISYTTFKTRHLPMYITYRHTSAKHYRATIYLRMGVYFVLFINFSLGFLGSSRIIVGIKIRL